MSTITRSTAVTAVAALSCCLGLGAIAREPAPRPADEAAATCETDHQALTAGGAADTCPAPPARTGSRLAGPTEPRPGVSAMRAFKDPDTGRLVHRPAGLAGLSLAERRMLSRSTAGLVPRALPGGGIALDLQGRFMNLTVARRNADGTITTGCIHDERAHPGHSHPHSPAAAGEAREARHE